MKLVILVACLITNLAAAERVRAFSDPEKFKLSALEGGGGGRFFTGSPVDGYACTVCHSGGSTPKLSIRGLPLDSYEPGSTYDVEVSWEDPEKSHALALELVTPNGLSAGNVQLVSEGELDARSYCDQDLTLSIAAYLTEVAGRKIVGVSDCGASLLRFRFTAPDAPQVAFSMGVVVSDQQGDSQGDGALHRIHTLGRLGERPPPVVGSSNCSTMQARTSTGLAPWLLLAILLLAQIRRARGTQTPQPRVR